MECVEIGSCPLARPIVVIRGERVDPRHAPAAWDIAAPDVVVGAPKRVLHHSAEEARHVSPQPDLERMTLQVPGRFDLTDRAEGWVGPGSECRWGRSVDVARTEQ